MPIHLDLPENPYNGKAVLLVPQRYLRDLPTLNADDFWEYCWDNENETIRNEFSHDITRRVAKRQIIGLARGHPEIRRRYLEERESRLSRPYDIERDPQGLLAWYEATAHYTHANPLQFLIRRDRDFFPAIKLMVEKFRHFVEENRGWSLLWNDNGTPRGEKIAQDLFLGIVKHYCDANNIDVSRESDIGRGPVDFKVSRGMRLRALMELKLAKNTRFWHGLRRQLPKYLEAEEIRVGYFVVVVLSEEDLRRIGEIQDIVAEVNEKTGLSIKSVIVDARPHPPSASRL